jgi:hypothetical protein
MEYNFWVKPDENTKLAVPGAKNKNKTATCRNQLSSGGKLPVKCIGGLMAGCGKLVLSVCRQAAGKTVLKIHSVAFLLPLAK